MAVVQISRIQVRRGREGTTGIPQLAGGEMGWAVDSQKLYIGNGSVAEGSPYVGNTEILTQHSNLLDIAQQYTYKRLGVDTGENSLFPVERPLQERLDEHVSVASFGAVGDGITDDTAAIQRALDELFFNGIEISAEEQRVVLEFLPGRYRVNGTLLIPPFANIVGAGKDKTVIFKDIGTGPVFKTVGIISETVSYTEEINDVDYITMARYINVSGITFETTLDVDVGYFLPTRNSVFENVKFKGAWTTSSSIESAGLVLTTKGLGGVVATEDNKFINCDFDGLYQCVNASWDINSNIWENCLFKNSNTGIISILPSPVSSGRRFGPTNNKFTNNKFIDLYQQAIHILEGTGNLSQGNTFVLVGNAGGNSSTAQTPVVFFGQSGNVSANDYFERSVELSTDEDFFDDPYVGEIGGSIKADHKFNTSVTVENVPLEASRVLFRLPAFNTASYRIHYLYKSQQVNITRRGVVSLFVDKINNKVHLTDEYDFLYANGLSDHAEKLNFTAQLANLNTTVEVKYTNQTTGDIGTIDFWYEVIS